MAITIGLDPGHGGSSSGTYSINSKKDGLFEKHYTLEIALLVEKVLIEHGFKTVLTRRTDTNPGNVSKRAEKLVKHLLDPEEFYTEFPVTGCVVFPVSTVP